ncbi:hypothetical protein Q7P35_001781 [Cladosporium inversicolor]
MEHSSKREHLKRFFRLSVEFQSASYSPSVMFDRISHAFHAKVNKPAFPFSAFSGQLRDAGTRASKSTGDNYKPSSHALSNDSLKTKSPINSRPHGILQYLIVLCKRLSSLSTAAIRRIFTKGYASLHITSTCFNALKRSKFGSLASPGTKLSTSRSTYRIGIGCARLYLLLSLPSLAAAQLMDDPLEGSHAEPTLTSGANPGTPQSFDWELLGLFVGGSFMIVSGGLRIVCNRTKNRNQTHGRDQAQVTSSLRSLTFFAAFTAASSVGWAVMAYTIDASHKLRYLGLTAWCMFAMAYLSEPFPGVTPQDRNIFSKFSLGGPPVCSVVVHYLSGGIGQVMLGYPPAIFTVWWIALDILTYKRRPAQPTNDRPVDEELGDIPMHDMPRTFAIGADGNGDTPDPPSTFMAWWNPFDFLAYIGLSSQSTNDEAADENQGHHLAQDSPRTSATSASGNGDRPGPLADSQQSSINDSTPARQRRSSQLPVFELRGDNVFTIDDDTTSANTDSAAEEEASTAVAQTATDEPAIGSEQVVTTTGVQSVANEQLSANQQVAFDSHADGDQATQEAAGVNDAAMQVSEGCLET